MNEFWTWIIVVIMVFFVGFMFGSSESISLRVDDSPMVVGKIIVNDHGSKYKMNMANNNNGLKRCVIYAPTNTWSVGDTIKLSDLK